MRRTLLAALAFLLAVPSARGAGHTFTVDGGRMLLDGRPFQMLCGQMDFARIPPELWRDRLRRARAMGLNTVATYVFWNVEEPEPGRFHFAGEGDVAEFVRDAKAEGLWVLLRPGPYVCGEWDFGGLPYWLRRDHGLRVRSADPRYMAAAKRYVDAVAGQVVPLLVTHGGPILMVQVENEYGSFGHDHAYMAATRDLFTAAGFDVPLTTADGPDRMAVEGSAPGALPTIDGGGPKSTTRSVDAIRPGGPYMVGELYPGWLDHWGEPFVHVDAVTAARELADVLSHGLSVNIYEVHGGTNFGFMNGANLPPYAPSITSYDYDAPIGESGRLGRKYRLMREVLTRYAPAGSVPEPPPDRPTTAFPPVTLDRSVAVTSVLPEPVGSDEPTAMEDLGQAYGFVLYRTKVAAAIAGPLTVDHGVRDSAVVMVDGQVVGTMDRRVRNVPPVQVTLSAGSTLDLLVENAGRINYGPGLLDDRKGITGAVRVGQTVLRGWQNFPLPMTVPPPVTGRGVGGVPAFFAGRFTIPDGPADASADTFLDMGGWGKGVAWVNGHNLGRFWDAGPQRTLYVPGPWLRAGANDVVVLELADTGRREVSGLDKPILDQLAKPATRADVRHGG